MHGAGNDFIVLDLQDGEAPSPKLCNALADRHTGVGCDRFLVLSGLAANMLSHLYSIWTAEGLPVQQCGNGVRCIASWALHKGLAHKPQFALDSPIYTHFVEALDDQRIRIALGIPQFGPNQFPLVGVEEKKDVYETYLSGDLNIQFSVVSIGNPHVVLEVDKIKNAQVDQIGQAIRKSSLFPPTANVGFAEIVSRNRINLRVYEYGAGEALACGSGACAAAAVFMRQGRIDRDVTVVVPGGELHINWPGDTEQILLTGLATFVFEGEFSHAPL